MITIDYQSRTPIYEQIVERFQLLIVKGALPPGSQIPSVRSLSMELSINPNTIQKAYALLEQQGYIFPVKGRGNFVSDSQELVRQKQNACLEALAKVLAQAKELGITEQACAQQARRIFGTEESQENMKEAPHD